MTIVGHPVWVELDDRSELLDPPTNFGPDREIQNYVGRRLTQWAVEARGPPVIRVGGGVFLSQN